MTTRNSSLATLTVPQIRGEVQILEARLREAREGSEDQALVQRLLASARLEIKIREGRR